MAVQIEVSADEVAEFLQNVEEVIKRPPAEWLYLMNPGGDGLPISFDHEWYPFIGKTQGFNPPDRRRYLPDGIRIIERIKEPIRVAWLLSGENIAGGRYFFASTGVFRINAAGERRKVISCNWPGVKFP